jgi:hypothetical protein
MKVFLKRGYRSSVKTNGVHYETGIHDLDDPLATYLIEIGIADTVNAVVPDEEIKPLDVHITQPAQTLMDLFDLTPDDFPDENKITKPMVDALLEERMSDGSE